MWLAQGYRNMAVSQMELCVFGEGRADDIISRRQKSERQIHAFSEVQNSKQGLWKSFKLALDPETIPAHLPLPEPAALPRVTHWVVADWVPILLPFLVSFMKDYL